MELRLTSAYMDYLASYLKNTSIRSNLRSKSGTTEVEVELSELPASPAQRDNKSDPAFQPFLFKPPSHCHQLSLRHQKGIEEHSIEIVMLDPTLTDCPAPNIPTGNTVLPYRNGKHGPELPGGFLE